MNRTFNTPGKPMNKTADRPDKRSFSRAITMLLVAGLTALGTGCTLVPGEGWKQLDATPQHLVEAETITREEYGRMAVQMREAVASGWLSEEEMTSKLGELRMLIDPEANDDRRAFREQIGARLDAIEEMVADGEMSREDADENIAKIRRRIAAGRADQAEEAKTFTRAEYARAKEKIDGMVERGEVSREDADTRLGQMRRMIADDK